MKRFLSLFLALAVLVGCLATFASCDEPPVDAGPEIAVYLGEEVYDFDPHDYYVNSNAEQLMSLIFEPLFRINAEGKLEGAGAKKYEVNEEERTIVIELRETYWSNDYQVKAQDYIYAWVQRVLIPERANPAAALFFDIENAIAVKNGTASPDEFGAVASDIYEITISYRQGADYNQILRNLASVATAPAYEGAINPAPSHWAKGSATIVTNGAFKLDKLNTEEGAFTLSRNMGYHQPSTAIAYADNVVPAKLVSFLNGYGEEVMLTYADIENKVVFYAIDAPLSVRSEKKALATVADDLSTYTYVLNTENELLQIPEVRRALSLALDRNAIAKTAVFGKAANSFVSASLAAKLYGEGNRPLAAEQNMIEAKRLIELVAEQLDGKTLALTLSINNDEKSIAIAEFAEAAWSELGFEVTVNVLELSKHPIPYEDQKIEILDSSVQLLAKDAAKGNRNFDILALDWQMYSDDPFVALAAFTSSLNGCGKDLNTNKLRTNISGWWSSAYDSYINAAYMAETQEERLEALRKAEEILLEECPVIPVLYNENFSFQSADISGVTFDGLGNFVFTAATQLDYQKYLEKPADTEEGTEEGTDEETGDEEAGDEEVEGEEEPEEETEEEE